MITSVLIARSLRTIGALASGESPEASEQADAFSILNTMLDAWRAERLTIFKTIRWTFSLVAGTQTYTLGDGATFDIDGPPPVYLDHAAIIWDDTATTPDESPIDVFAEEVWRDLSPKTLTSTHPQGVRYRRDSPFGTLEVWPIQTLSTVDLVLYLPTPLTSPALVTTDLSTPPGYEEAMIYNLAMRLAPEFGAKDVDLGLVREFAQSSFATIQRSNPNMDTLRYDPAVGNGPWWINPRTGQEG